MLSTRRNRKRLALLLTMLLLIAVFQVNALALLISLYILSGPAAGIWHKIHNSAGGNTIQAS